MSPSLKYTTSYTTNQFSMKFEKCQRLKRDIPLSLFYETLSNIDQVIYSSVKIRESWRDVLPTISLTYFYTKQHINLRTGDNSDKKKYGSAFFQEKSTVETSVSQLIGFQRCSLF